MLRKYPAIRYCRAAAQTPLPVLPDRGPPGPLLPPQLGGIAANMAETKQADRASRSHAEASRSRSPVSPIVGGRSYQRSSQPETSANPTPAPPLSSATNSRPRRPPIRPRAATRRPAGRTLRPPLGLPVEGDGAGPCRAGWRGWRGAGGRRAAGPDLARRSAVSLAPPGPPDVGRRGVEDRAGADRWHSGPDRARAVPLQLRGGALF